MNNLITKNIIRFIFLVLFQFFILNNIQLFGHLNPYLYILFILLLPLETPRWLLLVLAFILGFSIDYLSNTIGLNIAASVFIAFIRPVIIRLISQKTELGSGVCIDIRDMGLKWFFLYTAILVLSHHLILFYLEIFRFTDFFVTLNRAILSFLFTMALIFISQYLFHSSKK
ncbi:MAG: rod shape-determining protein MreD [Bacteroidetes bacterium]|nr:rod shape-determining protein MreD [Bacteroidota bacterium]